MRTIFLFATLAFVGACRTMIDRAPALAMADTKLEAYQDYATLQEVACTNPDPDQFWGDFELRVKQEVCHPAWEETAGSKEPCTDPGNTEMCRKEKDAFVLECAQKLMPKARARGQCANH
jgi:hypothetical protein